MIYCGGQVVALALSAICGGDPSAHWVMWTPHDVQVGIGIGVSPNERLIALVPAEGCSAGVKFYDGHYGDWAAATNLLAHSKVCSIVDDRRRNKTFNNQ